MPAPNISESAAAVRSWLMKNPRPKSLRVYAKDGREYDITIKPNSAWAETASSICSLDPERIEANGEEDKLIRACVVATLIQQEVKEAQQSSATLTAMVSADPETQRLIVFAELLARSSDRAIEMVERTSGAAFDRMQGICDALAAQATAAQQSANDLTVGIRNLMIQQAQEAVNDAVTAEHGPLETMAANFLAGQQMQQAEAAATAKPNGKH